ncbi:MAG: polysaccharide export protein [Desulfobacterales bacterium]|nr:polysaccharide export protein [Desulfobacterales bacterium]
MKHAIIIPFLLQFILVSFISPCLAQTRAYKIGPRDILSLEIYAGGNKEIEVRLTVSAHGIINAPFIGSVKAEGLTIPQLEERISKPLSDDYFVDPGVIINILEYHSLQYYISGSVRNPGLYEMTSETSLMELIAKAGGTLSERGNVAYIYRASSIANLPGEQDMEKLLSHKKPFKKINLKKLLDMGNLDDNLILKSGDLVFIPPKKKLDLAESMIYVGGEVKKPDFYEYQPGLTALNACTMAGGFDKFAAPNRTRIIRKEGGKHLIIKINLKKVMKGEIPDLQLKPGDRIHVPETWL